MVKMENNKDNVRTEETTPTSKPVLDNSSDASVSDLLDSIETVKIFLPGQSSSSKDAVIRGLITNCAKVVEGCLAKFKGLQQTIGKISEQTAAKRQQSINKLSEITRKLSMMDDMGEIFEALKKADQEAKEEVKVLETWKLVLSAIVEPVGGEQELGEMTPSPPPPAQASTPLNLGGEKDCAPAPPPPVEIKKTGSQQDKLEAKVEPLKISSSATAKELGAPGTGKRMDKQALLELMERHLESQQQRRDQDKSEFEYVGVPAPAATPKNADAQDSDSETTDDTDDDDGDDEEEEDDEDDFGSSSSEECFERKRKLALVALDDNPSPAPKKMKVAPASMNPFESIKKIKETEPERANVEATNGKGDHGAQRVPIQSNPASNRGSFRAASGYGFGTSGRGTLPGRLFGNKDDKEKPKRHEICKNCDKPFTNKDRFLNHQKNCKPYSSFELTLD